MTKLIIDISKNFYMIEKDTKMVQKLQERFGDEIVDIVLNVDVLDFEFSGPGIPGNVEKDIEEDGLSTPGYPGILGYSSSTLIVGNLPYYITSPILRKFFGNGKQDFAGGVFLIQREVGDKIRHDANKKSFLRRLLNYAYEVSYLKTVPAKAFSPPPKVQSCVIGLLPKKTIEPVDFDELFVFLDAVSGFKRKTLNKISKILAKKEINIDIPDSLGKKRLEEITRKEMKTILH